jgi:hypothetical protein
MNSFSKEKICEDGEISPGFVNFEILQAGTDPSRERVFQKMIEDLEDLGLGLRNALAAKAVFDYLNGSRSAYDLAKLIYKLREQANTSDKNVIEGLAEFSKGIQNLSKTLEGWVGVKLWTQVEYDECICNDWVPQTTNWKIYLALNGGKVRSGAIDGVTDTRTAIREVPRARAEHLKEFKKKMKEEGKKVI